MTTSFKGSWALITGASSGLGEDFARQLAAKGANVVLTARSLGRLEALARELRQRHGVETRVLAADLATESGIWSLLTLVDALGVPIDHVIANAGFGTFGPLAEQTERSQLEMVTLNCTALATIVRHFLPGQLARGRGGAILVASLAGFQPTPFYAVYAATKHFVRAFGEALAEEVRGTGVTISVLNPGPVPTGFQSRAGATIAKAQQRSVISSAQTVSEGLAGYERGQVIVVSGGWNKVLARVTRALPNRFVVPQVARMMKTKEKL